MTLTVRWPFRNLALLVLLVPVACGEPGPRNHPATLRPAYQVQGMGPDGAGYLGRAELVPEADGYGVVLIRGGDTLRGSLRPIRDDSIALRVPAPRPITGVFVRHPDGHLEGRWRREDGTGGWEVLRPYDTTLPPPEVHESYTPAQGTIRIGPGLDDLFPRTDRGYTLILPGGLGTAGGPGAAGEDGSRAGAGARATAGASASPTPSTNTNAVRPVAVFFDGFRVRDVDGPPVEASFEADALRAGVAILRITTGDPLDFLFTDASVEAVLGQVERALTDHGLDNVPLLFTGLSLGGTRAARAAIYLRRNRHRFPGLRLAALAVVDAPLDMTRLYRGEEKAIRDNVHPAAAGEGRWVTYRLREALGGPPEQVPDAYARYSPVTADQSDGGNVGALEGLPVRAYHEPDIDWWLEHRGKTYDQINSPDLALLVERLRARGSPAGLVTSHRQRDGWAFGSTPHTWSFVDNAELVAWFLERAAR